MAASALDSVRLALHQTHRWFVTVRHLAEETGLSGDTVRRHLRALHAANEVDRCDTPRWGTRHPEYTWRLRT